MASEKRILNESLVAVTALPLVMAWRNNTGQAWQGQRIPAAVGSMVRITPGMTILKDARPITFGLPGSPDILGVHEGRAFGVETKTDDGRQSDQQRKFQTAWERAGGIYGVARSPDQAVAILTSQEKCSGR